MSNSLWLTGCQGCWTKTSFSSEKLVIQIIAAAIIGGGLSALKAAYNGNAGREIATGNSVTRYYVDDVHYVAQDDVTKKIIQVADMNKDVWK